MKTERTQQTIRCTYKEYLNGLWPLASFQSACLVDRIAESTPLLYNTGMEDFVGAILAWIGENENVLCGLVADDTGSGTLGYDLGED